MRKLLLIGLFLLLPVPASAAISLVAHGTANATATSVTTSAINMTGATLLVVVMTAGNTTSTLSVSDSAGNSWTGLTPANTSNQNALQIFYVPSPQVSATQTFTGSESGGNAFVDIYVLGFSGTLGTLSVFDKQSQVSCSAGGTCQAVSLTPAGTGEVFITGAANNDGTVSSMTIDSSFSITDSNLSSSTEPSGAAYLVVAGSGAQAPTWTFTGTTQGINVVMAAFKPSTATSTPGSVIH